MQCKWIAWSIVLRQRRKAGDELRRANKIRAGLGQRRHMQRLANVASGVGTIRVMVKERAARAKVQQRHKGQQRQCASQTRSSEDASRGMHLATL